MDYRALNAITVKNRYSIPRIANLIELLSILPKLIWNEDITMFALEKGMNGKWHLSQDKASSR